MNNSTSTAPAGTAGVPCPPWCAHQEDASHARLGIDHVRLFDMTPGSVLQVPHGETCVASSVTVGLAHHDATSDPYVDLTVFQPVKGEEEPRWAAASLSVAEARRVAAQLLEAAVLLEG
jgi:hypothetical protein